MSPFETQRISAWGKSLIDQGKNGFGHKDVTWKRRALMALPAAGIEGQTLTSVEIEDALIPVIGPAHDRPSRAAMVIIGCEEGVFVEAGTMRRPEGRQRSMPEYHIVGHLDGNQQAVICAS